MIMVIVDQVFSLYTIHIHHITVGSTIGSSVQLNTIDVYNIMLMVIGGSVLDSTLYFHSIMMMAIVDKLLGCMQCTSTTLC